MPTFYSFNVNQPGENQIFYSFDDVFVPVDLFSFGNLLSWGFNASGQLGINDNLSKSFPSDVYYNYYDWKKISSGYDFAAAIRSDGTLWTWGNGEFGKLGDGATNSYNKPVFLSAQGNSWREISCGYRHMGGIKSDGSLFLWGNGDYGQLGRSISDPSSTPLFVTTNSNYWRKISCGNDYNMALSYNNTLWSWGLNNYGQLGSGNTTNRFTPTQIGSATDWRQVSAGEFHTAAIRGSGILLACGRNNYGQLGNGSDNNSSSLVQVGTDTTWKQVSCNGYHTVAIKTNGTMWAWGLNDNGQLGVGSQTASSTIPIQIGTDINWKQVSCGRYNNVAIKTDGSIWVWGLNDIGQLGLGLSASSIIYTPTQIGSEYNWKEAFVDNSNFYAIKYNNVYA